MGPPGSGKTTFCAGMQQYLRLLGRDASVVNLDPANEGTPETADSNTSSHQSEEKKTSRLPYETIFDVCEEAVELSSVMEKSSVRPVTVSGSLSIVSSLP